MTPIILAIIALATLGVGIYFALRNVSSLEGTEGNQINNNQRHEVEQRARGGLRRRRGAGRRRGQQQDNQEDDQEGEALRDGHRQDQDSKSFSRKDAYEAKRAARDAEREAQEAAQEAEILKAAQEREEREKAEAEKWMHLFTVEGTGEDAMSKEKEKELLEDIVEYLKTRKMVPLEDVAAEFEMKTADVIEKIQFLEKEKRITGIMDDRGKYIYLSDAEMKAVAEYIKEKGRIAISELAKESSVLIDFESKMVSTSHDVSLDDLVEAK